MSSTLQLLELRAKSYVNYHYGSPLLNELLGLGQDGGVWSSIENTAIKVLERERAYRCELESYQRLQQAGISTLLGFTIPSLVDWDDELRIVEMTLVSPPCMLDFAKVYFDQPPVYEEGVWEETIASRELDFEPGQWETVERLLSELQGLGIYYIDPKPSNIQF